MVASPTFSTSVVQTASYPLRHSNAGGPFTTQFLSAGNLKCYMDETHGTASPSRGRAAPELMRAGCGQRHAAVLTATMQTSVNRLFPKMNEKESEGFARWSSDTSARGTLILLTHLSELGHISKGSACARTAEALLTRFADRHVFGGGVEGTHRGSPAHKQAKQLLAELRSGLEAIAARQYPQKGSATSSDVFLNAMAARFVTEDIRQAAEGMKQPQLSQDHVNEALAQARSCCHSGDLGLAVDQLRKIADYVYEPTIDEPSTPAASVGDPSAANAWMPLIMKLLDDGRLNVDRLVGALEKAVNKDTIIINRNSADGAGANAGAGAGIGNTVGTGSAKVNSAGVDSAWFESVLEALSRSKQNQNPPGPRAGTRAGSDSSESGYSSVAPSQSSRSSSMSGSASSEFSDISDLSDDPNLASWGSTDPRKYIESLIAEAEDKVSQANMLAGDSDQNRTLVQDLHRALDRLKQHYDISGMSPEQVGATFERAVVEQDFGAWSTDALRLIDSLKSGQGALEGATLMPVEPPVDYDSEADASAGDLLGVRIPRAQLRTGQVGVPGNHHGPLIEPPIDYDTDSGVATSQSSGSSSSSGSTSSEFSDISELGDALNVVSWGRADARKYIESLIAEAEGKVRQAYVLAGDAGQSRTQVQGLDWALEQLKQRHDTSGMSPEQVGATFECAVVDREFSAWSADALRLIDRLKSGQGALEGDSPRPVDPPIDYDSDADFAPSSSVPDVVTIKDDIAKLSQMFEKARSACVENPLAFAKLEYLLNSTGVENKIRGVEKTIEGNLETTRQSFWRSVDDEVSAIWNQVEFILNEMSVEPEASRADGSTTRSEDVTPTVQLQHESTGSSLIFKPFNAPVLPYATWDGAGASRIPGILGGRSNHTEGQEGSQSAVQTGQTGSKDGLIWAGVAPMGNNGGLTPRSPSTTQNFNGSMFG